MLLVAGGDEDPNIRQLIARLNVRRTKHVAVLVGAGTHPRVTWELDRDRLFLNGRLLRPTAAFIRHDVFTNMADERPESAYRAYAWYSTLVSWVGAHPAVRFFNRDSRGELLKPYQLHLASRHGIPVPRSLVTNDVRRLETESRSASLIVKPVNGGDYCQLLKPLLGKIPAIGGAGAAPAIVQKELVPPDVRVFRVRSRYFTYEIESDALDYRAGSFSRVKPSTVVPKRLLSRIGRVSASMGLDYSATDLKWSSDRQSLVFLEVNSAPMFAAFDAASDGALCDAIIEQLTIGGPHGFASASRAAATRHSSR